MRFLFAMWVESRVRSFVLAAISSQIHSHLLFCYIRWVFLADSSLIIITIKLNFLVAELSFLRRDRQITVHPQHTSYNYGTIWSDPSSASCGSCRTQSGVEGAGLPLPFREEKNALELFACRSRSRQSRRSPSATRKASAQWTRNSRLWRPRATSAALGRTPWPGTADTRRGMCFAGWVVWRVSAKNRKHTKHKNIRWTNTQKNNTETTQRPTFEQRLDRTKRPSLHIVESAQQRGTASAKSPLLKTPSAKWWNTLSRHRAQTKTDENHFLVNLNNRQQLQASQNRQSAEKKLAHAITRSCWIITIN